MAKRKTKKTARAKTPLRLEYIEAGSLSPNPNNWKRHEKEQLASLRELLEDPQVGWAGVLLFNEKTGRLIDGHARQKMVDPKTKVPVLIGHWDEEAEAKILATLDPVTAMAKGDETAYSSLLDQFNADSLALRDMLDATQADLSEQTAKTAGSPEDTADVDDMALRPFEHYDYVLVLAKNTQDWETLCQLLKLKKVNASVIPGKNKIGLGRAIDAGQLIDLLRTSL